MTSSSSYLTAISAYLLQFPIPDLLALLDKKYYQGRLIGDLILKQFGSRGLHIREETTHDDHLQRLLTVLELTWRGLNGFLPQPRILPSSLNLDLFPRVNCFIASYPFEENYLIPEEDLIHCSADVATGCPISQRRDGSLHKFYIDLFARSSSVYASIDHSVMIQVSINGEYFDMKVLLGSEGIIIDANDAKGKKIEKYLDTQTPLVSVAVGSSKTAVISFNHNLAITADITVSPTWSKFTKGLIQRSLGFSNSEFSLLSTLKSLTIIPLTNHKYKLSETKYVAMVTRVLFDRADYVGACKEHKFYSLPTIGISLRNSFTVITQLFIDGKSKGDVKVNFETFGSVSKISPSLFTRIQGNRNSVFREGMEFFPRKPTRIGFLFGTEDDQTLFDYEYNDDESFGLVSADLENESYDILLTLNFISHFVTMFEQGKVSICESRFEKARVV
jgi:hypothetical protein